MSQAAAIAFILAQEKGDLVRNPGLSRWGIDLSRHPDLEEVDIINMTPERAGQIFLAQYWPAIHGDLLPAFIQLPMLDEAVNAGPSAAMKCLQRALKVPVDGLFGPQTQAALNHASPEDFLAAFTAQRILSYVKDKTWAEDGAGWSKRAVLAALSAQQ